MSGEVPIEDKVASSSRTRTWMKKDWKTRSVMHAWLIYCLHIEVDRVGRIAKTYVDEGDHEEGEFH